MIQDVQDLLAAWVLNDEKIITYRALSQHLKIPVNTAKEILSDFLKSSNELSPDSVHATYCLCGSIEKDGMGKKVISLVPQEYLQICKSQYSKIQCIHVYSLESCSFSDPALLIAVSKPEDVTEIKEKFKTNGYEDNSMQVDSRKDEGFTDDKDDLKENLKPKCERSEKIDKINGLKSTSRPESNENSESKGSRIQKVTITNFKDPIKKPIKVDEEQLEDKVMREDSPEENEDEPIRNAPSPSPDWSDTDLQPAEPKESEIESPAENKPEASTAPVEMKRKRRRITKKITEVDEQGYKVTRTEQAWESFSEDELPTPNAVQDLKLIKGQKAPNTQASIMSFFKKP